MAIFVVGYNKERVAKGKSRNYIKCMLLVPRIGAKGVSQREIVLEEFFQVTHLA